MDKKFNPIKSASELIQQVNSKLIQSYLGLFRMFLFCWNWKLFAESIINKYKS